MFATKENVAKLSIISITLLIVMKAVASVVTGSLSIRADAIHSVIDLSGVIIGYIAIKISSKPADEEHTFGHGKAENIASSIIAGLIFIAAGTIFYQAVQRLISGAAIELITVGIYVTLAAIVINGFVSWYAFKVARATDSLALEATARDLFADLLSSSAVLVGLILVKLTGIFILDPIVAMLVAVLIARAAYLTLKKSFGGLIDVKLPEAEEATIIACLKEHSNQLVGFHAVRTRKAGSQRFIDLHLVMPMNVSVAEAHQTCDHLEGEIQNRLRQSNVTIHVEPCDIECDRCDDFSCSLRSELPQGQY